MTTFADFKAKSILVKDVNETSITPGLLTLTDVNTLSVTPSSLSCNTPFTISNATLGAATGVTVSSTDNSTNLATTAFVKGQSYLSSASLATYATISSLVDYAKLAVAQTWSALQTFSSGIATNLWNATTATSTMTIGSNLTTGTLTLGTSTSSTTLNGNTTLSQLASPITPNYSYPISSGKVGYSTFVQNTAAVTVGDYNPRTLATLSVPPGVWGIMGHTTISSTGTGNTTYSLVCISDVNNGFNTVHMSHNQPRGTNYNTDINVSGIVTNSTAGNVNWYLVGIMGFGGNFTNNYLYIVRLA
jgi:hypothetical protein